MQSFLDGSTCVYFLINRLPSQCGWCIHISFERLDALSLKMIKRFDDGGDDWWFENHTVTFIVKLILFK